MQTSPIMDQIKDVHPNPIGQDAHLLFVMFFFVDVLNFFGDLCADIREIHGVGWVPVRCYRNGRPVRSLWDPGLWTRRSGDI